MSNYSKFLAIQPFQHSALVILPFHYQELHLSRPYQYLCLLMASLYHTCPLATCFSAFYGFWCWEVFLGRLDGYQQSTSKCYSIQPSSSWPLTSAATSSLSPYLVQLTCLSPSSYSNSLPCAFLPPLGRPSPSSTWVFHFWLMWPTDLDSCG